ncbi:hypothetical protein PFISCL1PPCAC_18429, partial [Pristionchus fissidentatus]
QGRGGLTRIPIERRSSETENIYESVEALKPVRVAIDYDPRYAKVVKPARPPPPRKPLGTALFAPTSRSVRERSPSKIVRIINGRSFSVDSGRRGRHRNPAGTSPTPPDPRTRAPPVPPSIETIPIARALASGNCPERQAESTRGREERPATTCCREESHSRGRARKRTSQTPAPTPSTQSVESRRQRVSSRDSSTSKSIGVGETIRTSSKTAGG